MSCYMHLSEEERNRIDLLWSLGWSMRGIAREIGRSPSTVSRELRRGRWFASNENGSYRPYRPAGLKTGAYSSPPFYNPLVAQRRADANRHKARRPTKLMDGRLLGYVLDALGRGWSPEQISMGLVVDFPDDPSMRVCTETLYQWIYAPKNAWRMLWQCLRHAKKHRRKARGRRARGPRIPLRIPISERPARVDDRSEFGHWESDTVIGDVPSRVCLHTAVERKTRYLKAILIPDKTAASTAAAELGFYSTLPPGARVDRTWDNGTEASLHQKVDDALGMTTYFADPYSSWQRGSNENRNGQIRRYLPKRTDFSTLTQTEVDSLCAEINGRPMKALGGLSPAQAFGMEMDRLQSEQEQQQCCTSN